MSTTEKITCKYLIQKGDLEMWKKALLLSLFLILIFPCFTFAASYDFPVDKLVSPIDSICGAKLGDNVEAVHKKLKKKQYDPEWSAYFKEKISNQFGQEYELMDNPSENSYDIRRTLSINADLEGTVNQISYVLHCRTNDASYQNFLHALIQTANNNFGTPQEQVNAIGKNGRAQHKIWSVGNQHLSIVTYFLPGYDPQHPYTIRIIRSLT